ncbi:MAG: hypothetical protein IJW60_03100 [Clostridia bacterium]|nr:hypothetical protein [Clostridia bacterium]
MTNLLKSYNTRLTKEAIIKSLICGLIVGFSALLISSLVFWIVNPALWWLGAIFFALFTTAGTFFFYQKVYRPSARQVAKRIDGLGLEERMLTMTQLEGDDSYIAVRQRQDAISALSTINAKLLKMAISVPLIVCASVTGVLGLGTTTVSALSAAGVISSGKDVIEEVIPPAPKPEFEINYDVKGSGMIEGDVFQIVVQGESATGVLAVPDDDWAFTEWSDGSTNPYREDGNVQENMTIIANFSKLQDGFPGDGDGQPGEDDGAPGDPEQPGKKPGDDGQGIKGGEWEARNQVIDGQTYYGGKTYENAYEDMLEDLAQNGEIPDELRKVIESYFETIEQ